MPDQQPHLSCEIRHRLDNLNLDAAFELTQPWTVLFGPSGSGKSTILRVIAGLVQPHHAKIMVRTSASSQIATDTGARINLAPHQRNVRWIAQRPALFPHMTVRENLRFAASSIPDEADQLADSILERFHLAPVADRRPVRLSGGEQQRASLARAVCSASETRKVRLLLLDEPFTGLDASLRDELIATLRAWQASSNIPVLSVTHEIAEAFQLNAEVIKLHEGRIIQQGPAITVLAAERARLITQLSSPSTLG